MRCEFGFIFPVGLPGLYQNLNSLKLRMNRRIKVTVSSVDFTRTHIYFWMDGKSKCFNILTALFNSREKVNTELKAYKTAHFTHEEMTALFEWEGQEL